MPIASSAFRMAERLTDGRVEELLREARTAGRSFPMIARTLLLDYGVEVSDQTLANWCKQLGVPEPEKAKAS